MQRVLQVAATPIGCLNDASPRLRAALTTAALVIAEDTRVARRLAALVDQRIAGRVESFHAHSSPERAQRLIASITPGQTAVLLSDAGTPGICDPGYWILQAAHAAGLSIVALPGPSACVAALSISGLPAQSFVMLGFFSGAAWQASAGRRDRYQPTNSRALRELPSTLRHARATGRTLRAWPLGCGGT